MRSLRSLRRCREAKRIPRSKERCVARGRQVPGKAPSGWGGDNYPGDAMTGSPPSTKRKLSSQDSNGQESSRQTMGRRSSVRAPVVLEILKRPRGCRLVLRPPSDQAGAECPGRSQERRKGPSRAKQAQSTIGCRIDKGINHSPESEK